MPMATEGTNGSPGRCDIAIPSAAQPRALPGCRGHLVMRPVHPQDHEPRAAGRAGQPVWLLVPARRPRLQLDRRPAVAIPLLPCGPVARAARLRPLLTYAMPRLAAQALLELVCAYLALDDLAGARLVVREATTSCSGDPTLAPYPNRPSSYAPRPPGFEVGSWAPGRSPRPSCPCSTAAHAADLPGDRGPAVCLQAQGRAQA